MLLRLLFFLFCSIFVALFIHDLFIFRVIFVLVGDYVPFAITWYSHRGCLGGPQPAVAGSSTRLCLLRSRFLLWGPTSLLCISVQSILTYQSWALVLALDSRLISSVHWGSVQVRSRSLPRPRLVALLRPEFASLWASAWCLCSCLGHPPIVSPALDKRSIITSSRYSLLLFL